MTIKPLTAFGLFLIGLALVLGLQRPGPGPGPPPAPGKFKCVLVSGDKMTAAQHSAMDSAATRDYLNSKCDGGPAGWKQWPADQDASNYKDGWAELWSQVRPKLTYTPAVVIAKGTAVTVEPFPTNQTDLMILLKKYGG